jgi:hypothetical protein
VPRLAADAHGTVGVHAIDDARAIVGVSECAGDGSGIPPEWLTLWCHCSAADGEAPGPEGLRRSRRATSSVPLGPAPGGVTSAIAAEAYRRAVAVVMMWVFI